MPAPLLRFQAIACPLMRDNVDTDALIPTSENTRVSQTGYGDALFAFWRYRDMISKTLDPAFVLNVPPYDKAGILLSGANFGCGSSRESAVWALRDFGFRIVVAESFNETFLRNCVLNGLAPLVAARGDLNRIAGIVEEEKDKLLEADLRTGRLTPAAQSSRAIGFSLDPYYRDLLMHGWTEDRLLASLTGKIDARRRLLSQTFPWLEDACRDS